MVSVPKRRGPVIALCAVALLLAACGTTPPVPAEALPPGHLYHAKLAFVRIEPIETGAPDNAHPATIPAQALRRTLAALQAAGTISIGAKPVFTDEELDQIAAPLAAALAKAGPREDVTFASNGFHGVFGKYSPASISTGRVFVHDGRVNVVFGTVHERYDVFARSVDVMRSFMPGSRTRRIDTGWGLAAGTAARVHESRTDWVSFDASPAPAATPARTPDPQQQESGAATPPPAPADSARYEEVEGKLKLLDRLKANGVITDDEYREQRRAILQGM